MLETLTKMLVFEISHHIIHYLSKSTTQSKFSAYLHLSPQWCRTSILTPHRHRLFATFLRSCDSSSHFIFLVLLFARWFLGRLAGIVTVASHCAV